MEHCRVTLHGGSWAVWTVAPARIDLDRKEREREGEEVRRRFVIIVVHSLYIDVRNTLQLSSLPHLKFTICCNLYTFSNSFTNVLKNLKQN